jgi:hypothetical protein
MTRHLSRLALAALLAGLAAAPATRAAPVPDGPDTPAAEAGAGGYDWRAAPPAQADRSGLARDTGYFLGYQALVIGVLYVAPESVSGWTDEDKREFSFSRWNDNVSNPHRDEDDFYLNYILHPYWGATYYIRGRERGLDRAQSFWFSALLSTLFEFGMEALFEQPSYQDLWTTPVLGSLIGEYWFAPLRENIRARRGPLTWQDKALLTLTDPLGVVGAETDRRLGRGVELRLHRFQPPAATRTPERPAAGSQAAAQDPAGPALGLQLRIAW